MHKTLAYYENNAKDLSQRYESAKVDNIHSILLNTFPSLPNHIYWRSVVVGRNASFMCQNTYDILAIDGSSKMIAEAVYQRIKGLDHYKLILKPNENGDLIVSMYSVG